MLSSRAVIGTIGVVGLSLAAVAHAQEPMPTVAANTATADNSKMRLGVVLAPMPVGTLKGDSSSQDAKFAFGIVPTFDFNINEYFFVGAAPQFIFNVNSKDGMGDAGKELDLRVRAGGNAKVADTIRLFGYLAPGYSIVMLPNKPDGVNNPAGMVLGFAGGALFDLAPQLFLSGEIGYQVGFQSMKIGGVSTDAKTNYLHIGVGVGYRL